MNCVLGCLLPKFKKKTREKQEEKARRKNKKKKTRRRKHEENNNCVWLCPRVLVAKKKKVACNRSINLLSSSKSLEISCPSPLSSFTCYRQSIKPLNPPPPPPPPPPPGTSLLHLGSAVVLGVLLVHGVSPWINFPPPPPPPPITCYFLHWESARENSVLREHILQ